MKVNLENSFEIDKSSKIVWDYFMRPMEMSECVPGISIDEKVDERNYKGKLGLQVGPISANYNATVAYEEVDEAQKRLTIAGRGIDTRGAGSADMRLKLRIDEVNGGGSKVDGKMEITINGKVAQFGSRLIVDVSNDFFKQFVSNFQNKLNNVELSESDKNVSVWQVIKSALRSIFRSK